MHGDSDSRFCIDGQGETASDRQQGRQDGARARSRSRMVEHRGSQRRKQGTDDAGAKQASTVRGVRRTVRTVGHADAEYRFDPDRSDALTLRRDVINARASCDGSSMFVTSSPESRSGELMSRAILPSAIAGVMVTVHRNTRCRAPPPSPRC